jgi:hypothetical protein
MRPNDSLQKRPGQPGAAGLARVAERVWRRFPWTVRTARPRILLACGAGRA